MRHHILAVDVSTNHRVCVALTISVECGFAEVGGEGRVCEPPCWSLVIISSRISLLLIL